jgi:flagellar biosynthetic protein FliP
VEPVTAVVQASAAHANVTTYVTVGALALVPLLFVAVTCFTRFVIVLAMLRHGLGLQQSPPSIVLVAFSLFLTLHVMHPVLDQVGEQAIGPFLSGSADLETAARAAAAPLQSFMLAQMREEELLAVSEMRGAPVFQSIDEIPFSSVAVAFMLNELRLAFQMGLFVLLPFLLIDLFVSSVLMGLGMIMVPPQSISLPLKLMVFLLIDGWALLTQSIVASVHVVGA